MPYVEPEENEQDAKLRRIEERKKRKAIRQEHYESFIKQFGSYNEESAGSSDFARYAVPEEQP